MFKKKRGRPPGKGILRKHDKWVPREWRPVYAQIVFADSLGLPNKDIGEKYGFTAQHVSNILNLPQAVKLREQLAGRIQERMLDGIPNRLENIADTAVKNIERVIANEELLNKAPMQMLRSSMEYLKLQGKLTGDSPRTTVNNTLVIGDAGSKQMLEGLMKSQRVDELHGLTEVPTQLVKAG